MSSIYVWLCDKGFSLKEKALVLLLVLTLGGIDAMAMYKIANNVFFDCVGDFSSCWTNASSDTEYMFAGLLGNLANAPQHVLAVSIVFALFALHRHFLSLPRLWLILPFVALSLLGSSVYIGIAAVCSYVIYLMIRRFDVKDLIQNRRILWSILSTFALLLWLAIEIAPSKDAANSGLSFHPLTLTPKVFSSWADRVQVFLRIVVGTLPWVMPLVFCGWSMKRLNATSFEKIAIVTFFTLAFFLASNGPNNDFTMRLMFFVRIVLGALTVEAWFLLARRKEKVKLLLCIAIAFLCVLANVNNLLYRGLYRLSVQPKPTLATVQYLDAIENSKKKCDPNLAIQGNIVSYSKLLMLSHRRVVYLDDSLSGLFNVNPGEHLKIRTELVNATRTPGSEGSFKTMQRLDIGCLILKKGTFFPGASPGFMNVVYQNDLYSLWSR